MAPLGLFRWPHVRLIHLKETIWLRRVLSRHIMEGCRRDVVGLALTDQTIILEEVFLLCLIEVGLRLQNTLGFRTGLIISILVPHSHSVTHCEIFSNFISAPRALLAAAASSSPAQSIGPGDVLSVTTLKRWASEARVRTCHNHHLSTMSIVKTVLSLAGKNMCHDMSNVLMLL